MHEVIINIKSKARLSHY